MLLLQKSKPPQIGLHKSKMPIKKGISYIYICSEINLALVSPHAWWIGNSHKRFNVELPNPKETQHS